MTAAERAAIAAVGMTHTSHPDKHQVRAAMQQHRQDRMLPTPEEYRRALGWFLLPNNTRAELAR